jgi:predicted nuclease of restriction endonuclease-like (RecB) superfamily
MTKLSKRLPDDNEKLQPLVGEISWSKNLVIVARCKDPLEREFYIRMTRKFGWSKNVLIHQIENQSYEKTLLGQTNFDKALTPSQRAQAKLAVKDEYTFNFLEMGEDHSERELERALIARIENFLRAMGKNPSIYGQKSLHRYHPLQGEEPRGCRICPARCPQAHRCGDLSHG